MIANHQPQILLVEDNETIRGAFGMLLEESGYRVLHAGSGAEAERIAAESQPDLILMDLGLPDGNGLDVTRRIKADSRTRDVPIVALTGRALETDRDACIRAGCVGYLTKPINTVKLLEQISSFIGRS